MVNMVKMSSSFLNHSTEKEDQSKKASKVDNPQSHLPPQSSQSKILRVPEVTCLSREKILNKVARAYHLPRGSTSRKKMQTSQSSTHPSTSTRGPSRRPETNSRFSFLDLQTSKLDEN